MVACKGLSSGHRGPAVPDGCPHSKLPACYSTLHPLGDQPLESEASGPNFSDNSQGLRRPLTRVLSNLLGPLCPQGAHAAPLWPLPLVPSAVTLHMVIPPFCLPYSLPAVSGPRPISLIHLTLSKGKLISNAPCSELGWRLRIRQNSLVFSSL